VALNPATRLGPYEIVAPLGAGGMGEVYRARDTRLDRDVAIKVLPAALAQDPEALTRFEREAKAVAALSHPNILAIHDVGAHDGVVYAVTELLEGDTLRERVAGGPLPLRKVIDVAVQMAHGLAAAHGKGIVHRDLKPENVFVTTEGRVKILDFGLAKAPAPEGAGATAGGATAAATMAEGTTPGTVVGTVGYMSPEQVRGQAVDPRTDIFAFGAVLYEILSGRRAFKRDTAADTMSAILNADPPELTSSASGVPPALDRILRRCLEKHPAERFHSAHDLALALETISLGSGTASMTVAPAARRIGVHGRERLAWAIALALVAAASGLVLLRRPEPAGPAVSKLIVSIPMTTPMPSLVEKRIALSPDGRTLVYTAAPSSRLYLRPIDRLDAIGLERTEGASNPFFSPDGRWIGFFADGKLKKVSIAGGMPFVVCDAAIGRGATWGPDGTIVFAGGLSTGLQRVSAGGGRPEPLTKPGAEERSHRWPEFLPDGKTVLFVVQPRGVFSFFDARVVVQSLQTGERKTVFDGGTNPMFADGAVIVNRAGSLLAIPFDVDRLEPAGPPVPVVEHVSGHSNTGATQYAVSRNGSIVYVPRDVPLDAEVVWVARNGGVTPVKDLRRPLDALALSPDGNRVALRMSTGGGDVWIYDFRRGSLARLTFTPGSDTSPVWTPDGRRILFAGIRAGPFNIFWKASDGTGDDELLVQSMDSDMPSAVSPDGRWLVFTRQAMQTGNDLWLLPLEGERKPRPLLVTPFAEARARFSPDGRWIAYQSNESGRFEVYVQPFPGPGGKWQVSTEGGETPIWSPTGRELFYRDDQRLMAVAIDAVPSFVPGTPRPLFQYPGGDYIQVGLGGVTYDVAPDGQRFLMIKNVDEVTDRHIYWLTGWSGELRAQLAKSGR